MDRIALTLGLAAGLLVGVAPAEAQRFGGMPARVRLGGGLPDVPSGFTFCRLAYISVRRDGSGNGWTTDFPEAERNLLTRLPELTRMRVSRWSHGEPGYAVVSATDPDIYRCPFIMATDVGELGFQQDEVEAIRDYLQKGGFFWADDFWGSQAWAHFSDQIRRLFPDRPLEEITPSHPLFNQLYEIPEVPQIPSWNSWRSNGGRTSELGRDSERASMWAVSDEDGRILVLITHNTDISDGWERERYDDNYFLLFSPEAYAVAVNVLLWAMTH
ncbi:MAG TPA: DUF4159 domain-containing protein [Longimicrobiales bacterium]|nr:DUF4159 domain-containing protein [Longimicrobiales bacterium]